MTKFKNDIWVISDTHFQHDNILKYTDRPYDTVEEMNEKLIENWNSVVKPQDKIYHLGDVTFGNKNKYITDIHKRLNGRKRLIVGNHDDVKFLSPYFEKVSMWRMWYDLDILMTHVPVHPSVLEENRFRSNEVINVHGHIHETQSPGANYKCVCVEQINYTPIHIEDLKFKIGDLK